MPGEKCIVKAGCQPGGKQAEVFDMPKLAKVLVPDVYIYISWRQAADGVKIVVKATVDAGGAVRRRREGADIGVVDV